MGASWIGFIVQMNGPDPRDESIQPQPPALASRRLFSMNSKILISIRQLLRDAGVAFDELHHPPTLTSEQ